MSTIRKKRQPKNKKLKRRNNMLGRYSVKYDQWLGGLGEVIEPPADIKEIILDRIRTGDDVGFSQIIKSDEWLSDNGFDSPQAWAATAIPPEETKIDPAPGDSKPTTAYKPGGGLKVHHIIGIAALSLGAIFMMTKMAES
jgi:hypothetical protein